MKPDHFKEINNCYGCKHCKLTYHHCSACCENDEYTCQLHDFVITDSQCTEYICDDFEDKYK